jgi:hypothetical protein
VFSVLKIQRIFLTIGFDIAYGTSIHDVTFGPFYTSQRVTKIKPLPVTDRGGLYGCEVLRIPHCLDNWLTTGGKVVRPTHRPRSTPQKRYFSASGTYFCYRLSQPQGLVRLEGIGELKKCIHFIGSRTHGLPTCSIVP